MNNIRFFHTKKLVRDDINLAFQKDVFTLFAIGNYYFG